jgi:CRP/FNR family cyclic AMP-dependent transcriptional regulator
LQYLARGDCFGEMALIDLNPRSASVVAVEDCIALEISHQALYVLYEHYLEQFTLIQMNLREVSRRLRALDERLSRLDTELLTISECVVSYRVVCWTICRYLWVKLA